MSESTTNDDRSPGPARRTVLAAVAGVAGASAIPGLSTDAAAAALVAGGATIYDGLTFTRSGYDYAPSVMYGDGDALKMWWCGAGDLGDAVFYSERTSSGWSDPVEVLTTGGTRAWDSEHVCDPSVVTGNFTADGESWDYAMYYDGTDNKRGTNTHIGVAFSNDGTSWQKYSDNPIIHPANDPAGGYGAGMQTAYREPGTDDTVTLAFYDSEDSPYNHYVQASDAVSFGSRTELTANPESGTAVGDVAYFPDESVWYVCTKHNSDEVCYLYKTANSDLNSTWTQAARIDVDLTGNTANHNPCWKRHPNGDLREDPTTLYKHVYFGTGDDSSSTWDVGTARYVDGWEFDDDGNREGWTSHNVSGESGEPTGGTWEVTADQDDPHWVSPSLGIDADETTTVVVRMSNYNDDSNGRIYFEGADDSGFSQDRSVGFDVDTTGDWVTYEVDVSSNGDWAGTVTRLRIDPIQNGTGDTLAIDFVRLDG